MHENVLDKVFAFYKLKTKNRSKYLTYLVNRNVIKKVTKPPKGCNAK